jgi:hypothetical protein
MAVYHWELTYVPQENPFPPGPPPWLKFRTITFEEELTDFTYFDAADRYYTRLIQSTRPTTPTTQDAFPARRHSPPPHLQPLIIYCHLRSSLSKEATQLSTMNPRHESLPDCHTGSQPQPTTHMNHQQVTRIDNRRASTPATTHSFTIRSYQPTLKKVLVTIPAPLIVTVSPLQEPYETYLPIYTNRELIERQNTDQQLRTIRAALDCHDKHQTEFQHHVAQLSQTAREYIHDNLRDLGECDGVLCLQKTDDMNPTYPRCLIVLPSHDTTRIIQLAHGTHHPSALHTHTIINYKYDWPGMYKDIQEYIQECDRCEYDPERPDRQLPDMRQHDLYPRQIIQIDTWETPHSSPRGHIILFTDIHSTFRYATTTHRLDALQLVNVLHNTWVADHGTPQYIRCPIKMEPQADALHEYAALMGMEILYIPCNDNQWNDRTQQLKKDLTDIVTTRMEHWPWHIQQLIDTINGEVHEDTNQSATQLFQIATQPRSTVTNLYPTGRLENFKKKIQTPQMTEMDFQRRP